MSVFSCYFFSPDPPGQFQTNLVESILSEGKSVLTYKNPLSLNYWANFNKLGTKHLFVKEILVCTYEGPHLFPRGDIEGNEKSSSDSLGKFLPILAPSILG